MRKEDKRDRMPKEFMKMKKGYNGVGRNVIGALEAVEDVGSVEKENRCGKRKQRERGCEIFRFDQWKRCRRLRREAFDFIRL